MERAIETEVTQGTDPRAWLGLAPWIGVSAARTLHSRAATLEGWLAVGLTRHAELLRVISSSPPPPGRDTRLARAIALLAIGDGADSATISAALHGPDVALRRSVASALGRLPQKRPRVMLEEVLLDADPAVRFQAARVLGPAGSHRARRVLGELTHGTDLDLARRAARALARSGYLLRPEELLLLSSSQRLDLVMREAARGRRGSLALLSAERRSKDPEARALAFAALAVLHPEPARLLQKVTQGAKPEEPTPELLGALALAGEPTAVDRLLALDRAGVERVIEVWFAYSSAPGELDPERAGRLSRVAEGWLVRGLVGDLHQRLLLRAFGRLDVMSGLVLARARLLGPDGAALRTAARMVGRRGARGDVALLAGVAERTAGTTRVTALRAAARVCKR